MQYTNSENEINSKSDLPSELVQRFNSKISWKRTKYKHFPYIIPLENSSSLENDEQIVMAGLSNEQIVMASPSDEQIVMTGPSDEQIVMAGSSDK
ncbi:hypothetical protein RclHR1_10650005 [Rhizophagus clarus]|uniref:Uncharacterized protein n=1 Tax=Rhizophagus clarus TaxID=94130 RepID=A0A2Z6Q3B0_9GLOM|nr:hypothetical protein RclHR1_10650005 [Rhizophagus clarus]GES99926.1 hypothetical protein GLOIN_2v1768817 [Rhizophagus clarus]